MVHHIFFYLVGLADLVSVFILWKLKWGHPPSQLTFRLHLARELIGDFCQANVVSAKSLTM